MNKILMLVAGLMVSQFSYADWQVVPEQSVFAVTSTKNKVIVETHTISGVSGSVSDRGSVAISLDLATLESNIPIRNQRMQAMLFAKHATATFTAGAPVSSLNKLKAGEARALHLSGNVILNGVKAPLTIPVVVSRLGDNQIQVTGGGRLQADRFGFAAGIEQLREIAGLEVIAPTVEFTLLVVLHR